MRKIIQLKSNKQLFKKSGLLLIALSLSLLSYSVTKTSTGNGNWSNASSWSPSGVPAANDSIIINHAIVLDQDIELTAGGKLTINSGASLIGNISTRRIGYTLSNTGPSVRVTNYGTLTIGRYNRSASGGNSNDDQYFDNYGTFNLSDNIDCNGSASAFAMAWGVFTNHAGAVINASPCVYIGGGTSQAEFHNSGEIFFNCSTCSNAFSAHSTSTIINHPGGHVTAVELMTMGGLDQHNYGCINALGGIRVFEKTSNGGNGTFTLHDNSKIFVPSGQQFNINANTTLIGIDDDNNNANNACVSTQTQVTNNGTISGEFYLNDPDGIVSGTVGSNVVLGTGNCGGGCTVAACAISSVTATPGACNSINNEYTLTGNITFSNAPSSGALTVSVSGGGSQVFNAPFTSSQSYSITGLTSNGAIYTVTAVFSADAACSGTSTYTAPASCSSSCTNPSAITTSQTAPTCTGATANNNGKITLTGVSNADRYGVSTGAVYSGTPDYASASTISLPQDVQTAIPNTGGTYTLRLFNGSNACFKDTTIVVAPVNCSSAPIPCLNSALWAINENDGHLFSVTNWSTQSGVNSTTTDLGLIKWSSNNCVSSTNINISGGSELEAAAWDGATNEYYFTSNKNLGAFSAPVLLKIKIDDLVSGQQPCAIVIGSIAAGGQNIESLAINPLTGDLFGGSKANGNLYKFNKATAAILSGYPVQMTKPAGAGNLNASEALTFDYSGNLYVSETDDKDVYIINSTTGSGISTYDDDTAPNGLDGLTWDFSGNRLIGFEDNSASGFSNLFEITAGNGSNIFLANTFAAGLVDIEGLELACPNVVCTPPTANAGSTQNLNCTTTSAMIGTTEIVGNTYSWSPTLGLNDTTIAQPTASPTSTTVYTVTVTGSNGCTATSSVTVNVNTNVATIGNYVWTDLNKNGINDEPATAGINGVTVELWDATLNTFVLSATTANDGSSNPGYYSFSVCTSGDYKVKFPTMSGVNSLTTQTTTAATDNNSDANPSTGESPVFTIDVNGSGVAKDNNTIDAGYFRTACLGNYVFNDINQDGIQNNGEVGVSGVTTTLYNATTNAILATVQTDAYGFYQFCGLNPGDYKVGFSLPTNYVFTTANNGSTTDELDSDPSNITGLTGTYTLMSGDSNMTVDAGIYQPQPITASIGDKVWFDADGDGIQDPTEQGVSGVTVTLYNCANPTVPVATTITGANGTYIFENVTAGSYAVSFTAPIGTKFTTQTGTVSTTDNSDVDATGKTACFPVAAGDQLTYVDAGIVPQTSGNASIGDKVWNDANQDGIQDPTETGVGGVLVTLYDATGTTVISTTTTDGLGNYGFNDLTPGCYVVGFSLPSGYTRSTQNAGTDSTKNSDANATTGMTNQICVVAGQNNPTIDAGIYNSANTNSIGDKVWYDENKNGLQDPTEYGYPGVVVTLYDCTTNTIIATTTTNASGNYLFDGIANGDYYVGFGFVPGYQFTGANSDAAGIAGANNSDANPSNGLTSCVSLIGNTNITTVDAGIYPGGNRTATSSLGDIVWTDANNNGLQDNGETGVAGVTVNLYNCTDLVTPIATTITDGLGNYIFTNLEGGNYVVGFNPATLPAGYSFTTKGTNIEDENNSDANVTTGKTSCIALGLGEDKMSVDAGIVAPVNTVCLGDYVWIDLDNDGTQEANEPAVPGVTVKLYDNNTNTVLQVATTNAEGKYLFCGLTNGSTYSVGFENLPAGFTFTTSTGTLATTDNSDANPTTGRTTTVTLGATNDLTLDAGIYSSTTAVVGNYVWYDEDADGIQDATEAPISGVLVTLYNSSNVSVASAVTDANGGYLFTNVTPGDYTIGFAGYPVTLVPTTKGTTNPLTADDDSNIDPITGKTDVFTVLPGSSNLTLDAGYKANPIAGLGNYVWLDVNDNGLQDASEPSISGVVVTLYAANGTTQLGTAITDGNGAYSFPNLTAGDYVVGFSNVPINYIVANQVGSLNDALNNDITTVDMKTAVITLAAGTYNPNIDAGFKFNPLGAKELKATSAVITSKNDCQVNWFTTDEENTQNFNITRSINGVNFETVGTILASNKTLGRTNYTFQDNIEAVKNAANIYYQIVLNDIDGKQTISNIISVKTNNTNDEISIYPIPFTDVISIDYPSTEATTINVELTDVSGRIIRTMNQEIVQGNNTFQLNGLTNIASGTYFLRIVNNNTGVIYSQKLTK